MEKADGGWGVGPRVLMAMNVLTILLLMQQRNTPCNDGGGRWNIGMAGGGKAGGNMEGVAAARKQGGTASGSERRRCLQSQGPVYAPDLASTTGKCPREMPLDMVEKFTMSGRIPTTEWINCDLQDQHPEYNESVLAPWIEKARKKEEGYYQWMDQWVYKCLGDNADILVRNKSVAIMGSQLPLYEAIAYTYEPKSITTIDFQKIKNSVPWLKTITDAEYADSDENFDVAISLSSFEHAGLGRYGDPLSPDGDFISMDKMKCTVKEGGYLVLSVPMGKDLLTFNSHRIYGPTRLPQLIRHWRLIGIFAHDQDGKTLHFEKIFGVGEGFMDQPVLLLKNDGGRTADFMEDNTNFLKRFSAPGIL